MEHIANRKIIPDRKYAVKLLSERLFCLVSAAALLAVCSRSSPLYPINYWVDANCFLTMGKAMMNGLVLYRDIYEQKGPLLYFLHGLAYLISNDGFLGVFLIEVLAFASFLHSIIRILRLYTVRVPLLLSLGLGAIIATSVSFGLGGSAEEFCLPLISWSLYWMLKLLREAENSKKAPFSLSLAALNGVFAGCLLWIKYNLLGFHFGWIAILCLLILRKQGLIRALKFGALFLAGILAATLPWIVYFSVNRALKDLWTAYFYNNIFLYSIPAESMLSALKNSVRNLLAGLYDNLPYTLPAAVGLLWTLTFPGKDRSWAFRFGVSATFLLLAVGIYAGGRSFPYYVLILSPYAVLGFMPAMRLIERISGRIIHPPPRAARPFQAIFLSVLFMAFAYRYANDTAQFGADRSAVVHYRFGEVMHRLDDDPTLLNYGFMDSGFYTASHTIPTCKYFCILNIPLREMLDAQDEYLRSGAAKFVVTKNKALDTARFDKYELVSAGSFYSTDYFLYRLVKQHI